jgi:alkylhydroperoxidase/carboxymuconolactone decarboxylase family protein YurZ
MKTKWIISVKQGSLGQVADALKEKGISDLEILEMIGVIVIRSENITLTEVKKIEGVENVEEERDINI